MGKFLLFLSFASLLFLELGSLFFSTDPIMFMSTSSAVFIGARAVLIVCLIALMVTTPPRNLALRILVGLISVATMAATLVFSFKGHMNVLDSLALAGAAVSMGIVALEVDYQATSDFATPSKALD